MPDLSHVNMLDITTAGDPMRRCMKNRETILWLDSQSHNMSMKRYNQAFRRMYRTLGLPRPNL